MKVKYKHDNYVKKISYVNNALKTPTPRLQENKHHIIPLQFIDNSMAITLPYTLHNSLHKNFTNYRLLLDPIGCLIKCIEQRMPKPKEELTLGHLFKNQGIMIREYPTPIPENELFKLIKTGFAYNVKSKTGVKT